MRRDGAANRERILVAAEHVFGTSGAAGSTEDIARRAEVGVATVFRHFPTKQDLFEATAARYLGDMELRVRELAGHAEPGSALAAVVRLLVATGPVKVALLNLTMSDGRELPTSITERVREVRGVVGELLRRAQAAGAARPDTGVAEVFTLARALAHVGTPHGGDVGDGDPVERAVAIVLDGLGVPNR